MDSRRKCANFMSVSASVSASASVSVTLSMSMTLSLSLSVRKALFSSLSYGATNIYAALAIVSTIPKASMRWR